MEGSDMASMSLDEIIKKKKSLKKAAAPKPQPQKKKKATGNQQQQPAAKKNKDQLRGTKAGGVTKQKNKVQGGKPKKPTARGGFAGQGFQPYFRGQTNFGGQQQPQRQQQRQPQWQQQRQQPQWQQQRQQHQQQQQGPAILEITNLDVAVSDADIKELFSEFGRIKSSAVHYGSNGVSFGSAHVHYNNMNSATQALARYNGVHLDGRAMKIAFKIMVAHNPMQMGANSAGGLKGRVQGLNQRQRQQQPGQKQKQQPGQKQKQQQQQQGQKKKQQPGQKQQQQQQQQGQKKKQKQKQQGQNQTQKQDQKKKQKKGGAKIKEEPPTVEQLNAQLDAYLNEASAN